MATSQIKGVIHRLCGAGLLSDGAGRTDGQLLEDYLSRRDAAALEALVRRHGSMVWGVCRRVLAHHHDAEDAFQATFLVLVRRAACIVPRKMVANWLYGVAHQTALKARATANRRKERERQVAEMPERAETDRELRRLELWLDEELSRLPEKYRAVVVLCDLDGKTRTEAARQLGWPEGTVAGRLARARAMLAKRLVRRGVVASGGALAAGLSQQAASAAVPNSVVVSTVQAASVFAAGQAAATGAVSVKGAALAEGVLKAMLLTKLKNVSAFLTVLALIGAGVIGVAMQGPLAIARPQADPQQQDKVAAIVQDDKPAATGPANKKLDPSTPEVSTLRGHSGGVYFAAFSPDGATLATAAKGLTNNPRADELIIWDVVAQRPKHRIQLDDSVYVWSMILSGDGKTLAVGTSVGIELRDAETGALKRTLAGTWEKSTGPCSLAFAPGGKTLAAGGSARDHLVRLWDVQTGELTRTLKGHGDAVVGLSFSADGKTLASTGGQYDTTIRFWEVATGRCQLTVNKAQEESKDGTEAVDGDWQTFPAAFSPDGKIQARGRGAEIKFWDARTGAMMGRTTEQLHSPDRIIQSLAFSPNGKLVAAGRTSGEIDVWQTRPADGKNDWRLGDLQHTLKKEHSHPVMALAFSSSGEFLASGDQDGGVRVWKIARK